MGSFRLSELADQLNWCRTDLLPLLPRRTEVEAQKGEAC
jgi:hypothetical protein